MNEYAVKVGKCKGIERSRLATWTMLVHRAMVTVAGAYLDPKNQLSVPSRSDNDAMASTYCEMIEARLTRVPKDGRSEAKPVRGAGGGETMDWREDEVGFEGATFEAGLLVEYPKPRSSSRDVC